jgi:hypothetical protein
MKTKKVILKASINRIGHLLVEHKSTKTDLYIQVDYEITDFLQNYIPKKYHKDLDNGWDIKFKMGAELWHDFTFNAEVYHNCHK